MLLLFWAVSWGKDWRQLKNHEKGNVPDCLKGNQATSDLVWTDFHDINLTGDSVLVSEQRGEYRRLKCLLEDAYTCTVAKFCDGLYNLRSALGNCEYHHIITS